MAGFWKKLFSKVEDRPWESGPAILAVLRSWDGEQPLELPDEEPAAGNMIRFTGGSWDGIATHHMGRAEEHAEARLVGTALAALTRLVRGGDAAARAELYRVFQKDLVAAYADTLLEELTRQRAISPEEVRPHARWLVRTAAHREPLKLGIVLLGLTGTEDDLDDLKVLARHDEFTLFAAVAVDRLLDDPVDIWWEMARIVHGWGKIQVVERLCRRVDDRPDVRAWLLRHGCANRIWSDYLAHACATGGRLIEALSAEDVDDELLDGARVIVQALLCGGPAEDIDGYPDGVLAVRYLLDHLETRCDTLARLGTVQRILNWLEWPQKPEMPEHWRSRFPLEERDQKESERDVWVERGERGWTTAVRAELAETCREILRRPEWPERVRAGHRSEDSREQHWAWILAPRVGVDLWEEEFARLTTDPLSAITYQNVIWTDDLARVRRVLAFAEGRLPLGEIASGPSDLLGRGPEFQAHRCLQTLVQEMQREGVFSGPLVAAALRSPVVGNRNQAAAALEHHAIEKWGEVVRGALRRAIGEEPNAEIRDRLRALFAKTA